MVGLGLVLGFRLLFIEFFIPNTIDKRWRDGISYDNIARNVVAGQGYWDTTGEWPGEPPYASPSAPTSLWPPGYPLFIAAIYRFVSESYRTVYLAQAVIGVIIAAFIYLLGQSTVGNRGAILAVFLYAVDPFAIWVTGSYQTETFFTLLLCATIYCFVKMADRGIIRPWPLMLFGLLSGVGVLTRSIAGPLFAALCLGFLLGGDDRKIGFLKRVSVVAIASIVFIGTVAPWIVRNYHITGQYVLSTQAWLTLAMANNDAGGVYVSRESLAAMPATSIEQPEIEREAIYKEFVSNWIATNPWQFFRFYLTRAGAFWSPFLNIVGGTAAIVGGAFNCIVLFFGMMYVIAARRSWSKFSPFYIAFLAFTLGYSQAFVSTRYRLPLYPLLEILAAGGMITLYGRYYVNVSEQFRLTTARRGE
jgi:4-amino-4-deoxy-L-arabinose transferase-like glycosyltransferase